MITVKDIREKEFTTQKHGYHEDEVDDFLDEIADQMEALIRENRALLSQLEEAKAAAQPGVQSAPAAQPIPQPVVVQPQPARPAPGAEAQDEPYFRNLEATLRETLLSAQRIADETVAEARKKAKQLVTEAEDQAKNIMETTHADIANAQTELEGIKKASSDYRVRFKRLVKEQLHALKIDEGDLEGEA